MSTIDSEALDRADMEQLVAGQDTALNALMDRHATGVFRFLCRMLGNEEEAHDLAQETFVRIYRARGRYRPGLKFSTWMFTIAANLARNQLRWQSRRPHVSLDAPSEGNEHGLSDVLPTPDANPAQAVEAAERAQAVRAAVQSLPEEMRETLVLCEWEELPVAEAAAILQTSPRTVDSRLYRARQMLRNKLRKWL